MWFCTCIKIWALIGFLAFANAVPWASPSLEILDELNDAEIYKAIVTSMNEWQRKQNLKKLNGRIKREDTKVCYTELGCFEAGYLDILPATPDEINTKFLLYPSHSRRRRSGSPPAEVPFTNMDEAFQWAKQGFNSSLPTKVLIHGFGSDCSHIWVYEMRSALMAVEEVNVICVDWEYGAITPNYLKASANTRVVGKQLAMLLKGLVDKNALSLRNTHLIGFSLGAHVAGFAGAELGNLNRITGLDPAGPLFESQDPHLRLDQSDADFVDVIHSNADNLVNGGLGYSQPMGHVDFYPNGGKMQTGCSNLFIGAVSDFIWSQSVEGRSLCNHRRAYKFFTDSVSPRCHFPAFPCDSYEDFLAGKCFPCNDNDRICGNMGYYADRSKGRGPLYLITRNEEPFCAHQYQLKIETSLNSQTSNANFGKIQITLIGDSTLNETFMMTTKDDQEMRVGISLSRILVLHPILGEPTSIEILYTAYKGWITSGLTQAHLDKIILTDSFGKISSVCRKNLILHSGTPVILPLYPEDCTIEEDGNTEEVPKRNSSDSNKEKGGFSLGNAINIFNIPWQDKENTLVDSDISSRAFNTKIIKETNTTDGLKREIVEPILKPHSAKNARSQDLSKDKPEITEPILGPTTARNFGSSFKWEPKNDFIAKLTNNNKEISYNFYDLEEENDWVPSSNPVVGENKWKREDKFNEEQKDPLKFIATTVQFLPQRLAKMFEHAERYARETILPLVSTYTPKFISDFISPVRQPKYLPLKFDETVPTVVQQKKRTLNTFNPPPKLDIISSTPYSHIQKIKKKTTEKVVNATREVSRKARDEVSVRKNIFDMKLEPITSSIKKPKSIYIDLPVFLPTTQTKYIPLSSEDDGNS